MCKQIKEVQMSWFKIRYTIYECKYHVAVHPKYQCRKVEARIAISIVKAKVGNILKEQLDLSVMIRTIAKYR